MRLSVPTRGFFSGLPTGRNKAERAALVSAGSDDSLLFHDPLLSGQPTVEQFDSERRNDAEQDDKNNGHFSAGG